MLLDKYLFKTLLSGLRFGFGERAPGTRIRDLSRTGFFCR